MKIDPDAFARGVRDTLTLGPLRNALARLRRPATMDDVAAAFFLMFVAIITGMSIVLILLP